MHIPRQTDGHEVDRLPWRTGHGTDVCATVGVTALRTRRDRLVGELRNVSYWQRLVQARTDLVVAGLLYTAPVPTMRVAPPPPSQCHDVDAAVPEGMDLARLLCEVGPLDLGRSGPGHHLEQLRRTALELSGRHQELAEELDAVNLALHDLLLDRGAPVGG